MTSAKKKPKQSPTSSSTNSSRKTDESIPSRTRSDPAARYTWPDVLRRVGEPTREEIELFTPRRTAEEFARSGREIRSERIVTDVLRWAGTVLDFFDTASEAQKASVVGYHPGLLRVLVHKTHELNQLFQHQKEQASSRDATLEHDRAHAASALDQAQKLRAQLLAVLRSTARVAPTELSFEQLDAASGTASDHPSMASSLRRLADLASSVLARKESRAARRLTTGGVRDEYLRRVRAIANELETAGARTSSARIRTDVSQSTLDRLDGECLELMEDLRDLFDAAHAIDPTVPRLIPIATKRQFISHSKARKPSPPSPPSAPARPNQDPTTPSR